MKSNLSRIFLAATAAGMLLLSSCAKDPVPDPVVEQEEFDHTKIMFIRLNADNSQTTDTLFVDFDKTGTPAPAQITLGNGLSYRMLINISLKGESINNEIIEEGTEHRFFFIPDQAGLLDYSYSDADADGRGIGLDGKMTVTGTGTLNLKVLLRHALDKSHPAAQAWNSTDYNAAGGEDDLNITFGIKAE